MRLIAGLALACITSAGAIGAERTDLPSGFVYLSAVDPGIRQDMRYASPNNFTGKVVDGYGAPECVLTKATALALTKAQRVLAARSPGNVLKVYDCFRPVRAVKRFASWSRERAENDGKAYHNPSIPRSRLFALGYIAAQSGHSRGNVVDLTIAPSAAQPAGGKAQDRGTSCAAPERTREADDSLDMGTSFDCFDARSNTWNKSVTAEQAASRRLLLEVMQAAGFENFSKEWWHYSYPPGAAGAHDFVITSAPSTAAATPATEKPDAKTGEPEAANPAAK